MKNDVKAIKLITGEELISRVTEGENNTLIFGHSNDTSTDSY